MPRAFGCNRNCLAWRRRFGVPNRGQKVQEAGIGRAISKYANHKRVFSQGTPADAAFYIQKGKVMLTIVSAQDREAVVAVLGQTRVGQSQLASSRVKAPNPLILGKI